MTPRQQITAILDQLPPQQALDLINSIGKERRRANSIKINKNSIKNVIDAERPDLTEMKR